MIKLLINLTIKNKDDVSDPVVRKKYGMLAGTLGIICNLILVIVKIIAGILMNSIAVLSDGLNNFSDMGSSVVALIGAKLSSKKPDSDHPYGHGRFEYISALVVSFIIMLVGFETLMSSVRKTINPAEVVFSLPVVVVLGLTCVLKLWMASFNSYMGKKINSSVLKAAAKDSLNDCFATLAVIVATVAGSFTDAIPFDGIFGIIVSVLILKAGFSVAKDTVNTLLGGTPDPQLVENIYSTIMAEDSIIGVHDLLVHDYGPGRIVASVHAEVPDDASVTVIHETIDMLERRIAETLGIVMVIHMDPIAVNCPLTSKLRELTENIVHKMDEKYSIHDFRITNGENNINLIFDLVLPLSLSEDERKTVAKEVSSTIKEKDSRCSCVINIDTV